MENQNSDLQRRQEYGALTTQQESKGINWIAEIEKSKSQPKLVDENTEKINQMLVYIFGLIGITGNNLPDVGERIILKDYIKSGVLNYSLNDLKNAFMLYASGKLDFKDPPFQKFSVLFLENIMQSYRRYVINLPKKNDPLPVNEPTPEEIEKMMWDAVNREFESVKAGNGVQDYGNCVYNFLDKKGKIPFNVEMKNRFLKMAMEGLKTRAKERNSFDSIKAALNEIEENRGNIQITWAKKIALHHLFAEMINMDETVNDLKQ